MRILAHIHTFNDEAVIDRSLAAVLAQTRAVDGVVIVDNGSTDATLDRDFPPGVTVIRHGENLGTNGSVNTGMRHAIEHGYDWIWLFDADSAPRPEALKTLLEFHAGLAEAERRRTYRISSLCVDLTNHQECHGAIYSPAGFRPPSERELAEPYECTVTIWSGSLYRTDAVRDIGLPALDYVLDIGEFAYGYIGSAKGWKAYMVPASLVDHNIRGVNSVEIRNHRIGPLRFRLIEMPPIRCYYLIRNRIYFWLYQCEPRKLGRIAVILAKSLLMTGGFLVRPWSHGAQLVACLRGVRDGLTMHMERRY